MSTSKSKYINIGPADPAILKNIEEIIRLYLPLPEDKPWVVHNASEPRLFTVRQKTLGDEYIFLTDKPSADSEENNYIEIRRPNFSNLRWASRRQIAGEFNKYPHPIELFADWQGQTFNLYRFIHVEDIPTEVLFFRDRLHPKKLKFAF